MLAGPPVVRPAVSGAGTEDLVHLGFPYVVSISCTCIRNPNAWGLPENRTKDRALYFNELGALTDRTAVQPTIPFGGRGRTK